MGTRTLMHARRAHWPRSASSSREEIEAPVEMLEMHAYVQIQWAQKWNRGNVESRRFELSASPLVACMHAHSICEVRACVALTVGAGAARLHPS